MKTKRLFLFLLVWHSIISAQTIDSCNIYPSFPSENDSAYIHIFGKHLNTAYVITDIDVSVIGSIITVEINYYKGNGFWQEIPYDTIVSIGKLQMQNYIANSYTLVPEVYDSCCVNFSVSRIADFLNSDVLNVFPNPTSDFLIIETNQPVEPSVIILTDITGRIVYQSTFTSRIDVSHLPKGMYVLSFFSNARQYVSKVIVQ